MEIKKKPTEPASEDTDVETSTDDALIKNIWECLRRTGELAPEDEWQCLNIH